MPLTQGRYMEVPGRSRWQILASRARWLLGGVVGWFLYPPWRRHPEDTGGGFQVRREWGCWTVRPCRGWRSVLWLTPPLHATRRLPASDRDDAGLWAARVLGIPV